MSADKDLQWLSQGGTVIAAEKGIALYAHGSKPPAGKPNTETGIALHAAQGPVSARVHRNLAKLAAQTSVTLTSTSADISIAAPNKHLLATAAGGYIRLEGGNIELGAPGTIEFKAAKKEWTIAQPAKVVDIELLHGALKMPVHELIVEYMDADGTSPSGEPITLRDGAGCTYSLTLSNGMATVPNFKPGLTFGGQPKRK